MWGTLSLSLQQVDERNKVLVFPVEAASLESRLHTVDLIPVRTYVRMHLPIEKELESTLIQRELYPTKRFLLSAFFSPLFFFVGPER